MAIRVAVDALGGDHAPSEVVAGAGPPPGGGGPPGRGGPPAPPEGVAGAAAAAADGLAPVLFGPASLDPCGLELVACTETIGMEEKPAEAVRAKPDATLVRAVGAVARGDADAVVSAGNTGAMLAASLLQVRRLPGVLRPGIAVVIPGQRGPTVLIDAGANADARAEHLVQFAYMGVVFAQELLDVPEPSVRLLSIGEEREKGNQLTLDAHALLERAELRFDGNIEGRTLLEGDADVVVCDGFTGNVALKTLEGTIRSVIHGLRQELRSSVSGRIGGLLIRAATRGLRARLDPDTYGGGYLLGLDGLVVIAHGSSSRVAIANATRMAARGVEHRLVERLAERLPASRAEAHAH